MKNNWCLISPGPSLMSGSFVEVTDEIQLRYCVEDSRVIPLEADISL